MLATASSSSPTTSPLAEPTKTFRPRSEFTTTNLHNRRPAPTPLRLTSPTFVSLSPSLHPSCLFYLPKLTSLYSRVACHGWFFRSTPLRSHTKHPLPLPPPQIHVPVEAATTHSSTSVRSRSSSSAAALESSPVEEMKLWYEVKRKEGVIKVPERVR